MGTSGHFPPRKTPSSLSYIQFASHHPLPMSGFDNVLKQQQRPRKNAAPVSGVCISLWDTEGPWHRTGFQADLGPPFLSMAAASKNSRENWRRAQPIAYSLLQTSSTPNNVPWKPCMKHLFVPSEQSFPVLRKPVDMTRQVTIQFSSYAHSKEKEVLNVSKMKLCGKTAE